MNASVFPLTKNPKRSTKGLDTPQRAQCDSSLAGSSSSSTNQPAVSPGPARVISEGNLAATRLYHDPQRLYNDRRSLPKLPVTAPRSDLVEVVTPHLRQDRGPLDAQPIPRVLINLFSQGEIQTRQSISERF